MRADPVLTHVNETLDDAMARIGESTPLQAVALEPELARPKSFLKVLDADHYNWEADRFRKLFAMRFRVSQPGGAGFLPGRIEVFHAHQPGAALVTRLQVARKCGDK